MFAIWDTLDENIIFTAPTMLECLVFARDSDFINHVPPIIDHSIEEWDEFEHYMIADYVDEELTDPYAWYYVSGHVQGIVDQEEVDARRAAIQALENLDLDAPSF